LKPSSQRVTPDMLGKKHKKRVDATSSSSASDKKGASGLVKSEGSLLSALAAFDVGSNQSTQSVQTPTQTLTVTQTPSDSVPKRQLSTENDNRMRIVDSMREGLTDQQIAIKFDTDLASVIRIRKDFIRTSKMNDPRALFSKRLSDIDEAFEVAKDRFFDDPGNEAHMKGMNDFAKTLRELVDAFNNLENPADTADVIIKRIIRPLVMGQIDPIIESLSNMQTEVSSFLPEHSRAMLETSVLGAVRRMQEASRVEYNKAVSTLSQLFNVDLTTAKITSASEVSSAKD
jgi:hypothetical protein